MIRTLIKSITAREDFHEVVRFGIVGAFSTVLQATIYYFLAAHMSHNLALPVSYLLSMIVNFTLTTYFTFKVKPSRKNGVGFLASHAITITLQFLLLNFFVVIVGLDKQIAVVPMLMVVVPISFLLVRYVMKHIQ